MPRPNAHTVETIITHTEDGLIKGFSWEITTNAAIITSRNIIDTKNNCFNSLKNHYKFFIGRGLDRMRVKNREEAI